MQSRLAGLDDRIDMAALGGDIEIGEALAELLHLFLARVGKDLRLGLFCEGAARRPHRLRLPHAIFQLSPVDHVDRGLCASAPITAISAVGHARFTSVRKCLELITQYAPP